MRKYFKVMDIGLQNTFTYRWNFLLRGLFSLVPLIGTVHLWGAVFKSNPGEQLADYNYPTMVSYFLLTIFVNLLTVPTEDEWQIASDIKDGFISSILLKPIDYLYYRICLFASYRLIYTLVTIIPIGAVIFSLREYLTFPSEPWIYACFLMAIIFAALLQFLLAYSLALLAFWIQEISTIIFIVYAFEFFFSGQMFPIDILPPVMITISRWLPFQYESFFPVHIYQEKLTFSESIQGLCIAFAWTVIMYLFSRWMFRQGIKQYTAVGG